MSRVSSVPERRTKSVQLNDPSEAASQMFRTTPLLRSGLTLAFMLLPVCPSHADGDLRIAQLEKRIQNYSEKRDQYDWKGNSAQASMLNGLIADLSRELLEIQFRKGKPSVSPSMPTSLPGPGIPVYLPQASGSLVGPSRDSSSSPVSMTSVLFIVCLVGWGIWSVSQKK